MERAGTKPSVSRYLWQHAPDCLPPWSPQLNPAEHVWDEIREKWFANRHFENMDQLERQLVAGLASLEADASRVASLTGFDWVTCVPLKAH